MMPQGQSYASLLPHVPLPLVPSDPPHLYLPRCLPGPLSYPIGE